jgi:hypothetical protein
MPSPDAEWLISVCGAIQATAEQPRAGASAFIRRERENPKWGRARPAATARPPHIGRWETSARPVRGRGRDPAVTDVRGHHHPLARHVDNDLADLANVKRSGLTIRGYGGDLMSPATDRDGEVGGLTRRAHPGVPGRPARSPTIKFAPPAAATPGA